MLPMNYGSNVLSSDSDLPGAEMRALSVSPQSLPSWMLAEITDSWTKLRRRRILPWSTASRSRRFEEYRKPRPTGTYYYGFFTREGTLEAYARRVNSDAEKYRVSQQRFYAVDYMRWIINDQSLDMQIAVLRRRHERAIPFIHGTVYGVDIVFVPFWGGGVRGEDVSGACGETGRCAAVQAGLVRDLLLLRDS